MLIDFWRHDSGALSVQVLQEFYNVTTRKLKASLPRSQAQAIVEMHSDWCGETSTREIQAAFAIENAHQISFWDALIVASAQQCGATILLSEDLHHGQVIAGVEIVNPFLAF